MVRLLRWRCWKGYQRTRWQSNSEIINNHVRFLTSRVFYHVTKLDVVTRYRPCWRNFLVLGKLTIAWSSSSCDMIVLLLGSRGLVLITWLDYNKWRMREIHCTMLNAWRTRNVFHDGEHANTWLSFAQFNVYFSENRTYECLLEIRPYCW